MKVITLSKGEQVLVDDEDFDYLNEITWRNLNGYAVTTVRNGKTNKNFYMHKMVMQAGKDQIVDHIDGDKFNNCKNNLRYATKQGNQRNQKIRLNNTTGFKGVHLNKKTGRYVVQIGTGIPGKHDTIGTFSTAEEAALMYNIEAIKRFGEYARLNTLKRALH